MFELLDELSELIYVVELDTYNLLYMNHAGKELFCVDDVAGKKCYEVIQDLDAPCPHCNNAGLDSNSFYTWEYTNPKVKRHYLLKDRLVQWGGKTARAEIAFDMTEKERKQQKMQDALGIENLVTACAKRLCDLDEDGTSIDDVLSLTGRFLHSDRTYIFEIFADYIRKTHEWCAPGVKPHIQNLQRVPLQAAEYWRESFQKRECIVIEDVEGIRDEAPPVYDMLKRRGLRSLIAAPLVLENQLIGYVGADNFCFPMRQNTIALLTSVSYFLASAIRHSRAMRQLEEMGYCDSLTKLINRNGFMQDVEKEFQYPVGVIYLDINGMKELNDQYGHQRGDQALVDTAKSIREIFSDHLCYRVGGDEFVVICENTAEAVFEGKVREMRDAFRGKRDYSVSVGSAWSGQDIRFQNLLHMADERMYRDKKEHYRGTAMSERYRYKAGGVLNMARPEVLRRMIEDGCFRIYYQPKFSLESRQLTGAEALVRFVTRENILYPPDLFIPVLEETRLIGDLDFYVFEQVCRQLRRWMDDGLSVVPVSANFSIYTLSTENFAGRLQAIRDKYGIQKAMLEIEVTETVDSDNRHLFYNILEQLKQNQFSISIDDFGDKNANLLLFTDISFDVLKIDKSVVGNICKNDRSRFLISALTRICHEQDIKVVAEGVETEAQFEILRQEGCDDVQGYLFCRPVPVAEFQNKYLSGKRVMRYD